MTKARAPSTPLRSQVDHLVVAAASLDEGVAWCEATLGITPGPGGEHPLMGTHNRLFSIASPAYHQAYFEIIAIHPGAPCARSGELKRWFDLDNHDLQAQLKAHGPQLVHFVANTTDAMAGVQALKAVGLDRGPLLAASRMTPNGLLSWKITVRDDGQRLFYGALPTLIEWGEVHPAQGMAESGVTLTALEVSHPRSDGLRAAHESIGLAGVALQQGPPNLRVTLQTPNGERTLESHGI